MQTIYLTYTYNGKNFHEEVEVVDYVFWLFRIVAPNNIILSLQYDFFSEIWKEGSDNFVDPELIQIIGDEIMELFGSAIQDLRSSCLFSSPEYFTCQINNKDIIGFWGKRLHIRVSNTLTKVLNTNENEIHYYGTINNHNFFFETESYDGEDRGMVMRAIHWYAIYINHPLMKIKSNVY